MEDYQNNMRQFIKSNKLMLSEKQINILDQYGIDYTQNVKMILYEIDEILNNNYDELLDEVSREIAEMDYYHSTNK